MVHPLRSTHTAVDPVPRRMSEQEFLAWMTDTQIRAEWVDGEVFELGPPDDRHQDISGFLLILLRLFTSQRQLGKVLSAPFEMRLRFTRSYREPDLLFVATEHLDRLDGKRLNGPADLAVEIVGDDSSTRDLRDKFREYAAAGVQEYWIIDPRPKKQIVQLYARSDDGVFELLNPDDAGRILSRVLPGMWIDPRWLEADPLPNELEVLATISPETFGRPETA